MTIITVRENGLEYQIRIPNHHPKDLVLAFQADPEGFAKSARVANSTRALPEQMAARVVEVSPKGAGTGAVPAPVRGGTRAPAVPAPPWVRPEAAGAISRIDRLKADIKELVAEKIALTPASDSHAAALRSVREKLQASHKTHPILCSAEVTAHRLGLHDRILEASQKWGRQARRHREVNGLISTLSDDLSRLERAEAR